MKKYSFSIIMMILILSSCKNKNGEFDASGVFEATEVLISANANGEILKFNVEEGQKVTADEWLGYIDTTQLYLKKIQFLANMKASERRFSNVTKQIAAIKQQLDTQHKQHKRFDNLVNANTGNSKQQDDTTAQIALLES